MYTNTKDLSSTQVCDATRVSYRQLDYWLNNGVIPAYHVQLPSGRGSGHHRRWSPDVLAPLTVLHYVTAAFPMPLDTTILADIYIKWSRGVLHLTDDVAITWTVPT